MSVEVRTVNLSRSEAFDHLKDHFSAKGVKMIGYHRPIRMNVEFGSFFDRSYENSLGQAFIRIIEKDGKSTLIFDFDFKGDRLFGIFYYLVFILGVSVLFVYNTPGEWGLSPLVPVPLVPVSTALFIAIVFGLFGAAISSRFVSRTKSRFMDDVTSSLP